MKKVAKWFTWLALVSTGMGCQPAAMREAPVPLPTSRPFSYEIVALSALPVEKGAEYVAINGTLMRMTAQQLSVSLKDESYLESFLARHGATVLEQQVFYAGPRIGQKEEGTALQSRTRAVYNRRPDYLVSLPPVVATELGELDDLAARAGVQGHFSFHSDRGARLFAQALKIRLDEESGVVGASLELSAARRGEL